MALPSVYYLCVECWSCWLHFSHIHMKYILNLQYKRAVASLQPCFSLFLLLSTSTFLSACPFTLTITVSVLFLFFGEVVDISQQLGLWRQWAAVVSEPDSGALWCSLWCVSRPFLAMFLEPEPHMHQVRLVLRWSCVCVSQCLVLQSFKRNSCFPFV